jgi:hypothetical protein
LPLIVGVEELIGARCPGAERLAAPATPVAAMNMQATANAQWRRRIPALSAESTESLHQLPKFHSFELHFTRIWQVRIDCS